MGCGRKVPVQWRQEWGGARADCTAAPRAPEGSGAGTTRPVGTAAVIVGVGMAVGTSFVCKCCGMQGSTPKPGAPLRNQTDDLR